MESALTKDIFPKYLRKRQIVIYFQSIRETCNCPYCNNLSSTNSTYFTRDTRFKYYWQTFIFSN